MEESEITFNPAQVLSSQHALQMRELHSVSHTQCDQDSPS